MDESIFLLEDQDNVGDVLGKINYNFLKQNNDLHNLELNIQDNYTLLRSLDKLMDRLDYLMANVDLNVLQDLYTTVNFLSSYWNTQEFTVYYPFNPDTGYTVSLASAGSTGTLLGSTEISEHENILINALLTKNLPYIQTEADARLNLSNNGLIFVNRTDSGDFVAWDFINSANIFSILADKSNNLYYNGRLVDIYNIPYNSVITGAGVDVTQPLIPDYNSKLVLTTEGTPLRPDNYELNSNVIIEYKSFTYNDYSDDDDDDEDGEASFVPITELTPEVEKLSSTIPENNPSFASKIVNLNDDLPGDFQDNTEIYNLALEFLNDNYPPAFYPKSTIVNVVFLLYNKIGNQTGKTTVQTLGWDKATLKKAKNSKETLKKSTFSKTADASNTTYNIDYAKQNVYIEKIVNVKYEKTEQAEEVVTVIGGIHKSSVITVSKWEYKGISIGKSYTPKKITSKTSPYKIKGTPAKIVPP